MVTGWIFKYTAQAITGTLSSMQGWTLHAHFNNTALSNVPWQLVGMVVTIAIMAFGVGRGIEKANKVMTPLFFVLFIGLPSTGDPARLGGGLPLHLRVGARGPAGPHGLGLRPGSGLLLLVGGGQRHPGLRSYLSKARTSPPRRMVALFDTLAAILAAWSSSPPWLWRASS